MIFLNFSTLTGIESKTLIRYDVIFIFVSLLQKREHIKYTKVQKLQIRCTTESFFPT